jgi:hypothetical protein
MIHTAEKEGTTDVEGEAPGDCDVPPDGDASGLADRDAVTDGVIEGDVEEFPFDDEELPRDSSQAVRATIATTTIVAQSCPLPGRASRRSVSAFGRPRRGSRRSRG